MSKKGCCISCGSVPEKAQAALSLEARGMFKLMRDIMSKSERPGFLKDEFGLPVSPEQLAAAGKCSTDRVTLILQELTLAGFIKFTNGVYHSPQVQNYAKMVLTKRKNGERGQVNRIGEPIRLTEIVNSPVDLEPSPPLSPSPLSPTPPITPTPNSPSPPVILHARRFEPGMAKKLFNAYPRRQAWGAAMRAIEDALVRVANRPDAPSDVFAWLLSRVEEYAKSPAGMQAMQYIPLPEKWFNGEQYDDDPRAWQIEEKQKGKPNGTTNTNRTKSGFDAVRAPEVL